MNRYTTPEAAEAVKLYLKHSMRTDAKYFHNVSNKAISRGLGLLAAKAGIIEKGKNFGFSTRHRNEIPAVHGLRKFSITQMAKAKVDTEIAKLLTGKTGVFDSKQGKKANFEHENSLEGVESDPKTIIYSSQQKASTEADTEGIMTEEELGDVYTEQS